MKDRIAPKLKRGLFISLEGGEGVGKSTQVRLLADTLERIGFQTRTFREPGGTKIGEAIRFITHDPTNTMMDHKAEALLFAACRAQLVSEVYKPLMAKKFIVIADRYVDSSYVYQGIARGLGYREIKKINDFAIDGLLPDLTFLIDLDYLEGQRRRRNTVKIDRMDMQKQEFYKKVHAAYHKMAKHHSGRIVVIEGKGDVESIHNRIAKNVIDYLNKKLIKGEPIVDHQYLLKSKEVKSVEYNWLVRER